MEDPDNYLMVAALDFGTTYSGYAFSVRQEFKTDPLKIQANQAWNAGSRTLMSMKTPTCLLLNSDKEFEAFGYEAENMYADVVMDGQQADYYYFDRFKMNLHNNKNITQDMMLEDVTGKPLRALEVFTLSIQALVDHLMTIVEKQRSVVKKEEVRWVLTVPAIWTDSAKQFMRKSAEDAGILPNNLILALEPETASIYCQYLPTEKIKGATSGFTMTQKGTKYMVVDIGGGTADFTVHEKIANGQLKELHRATGNNCGGTSVDRRFFQMLEQIAGKNVMLALKKEDPLAYLDLVREFEAVKRTVEPKRKTKVNLTIPFTSLDKLCKRFHDGKEFQEVINNSPHKNDITIFGDKLRFSVDTIKRMFKPTIDSIISQTKEILGAKSTVGVSKILMVGGFSECLLLQEAIHQEFPEKQIIIPEDSGLAVLKGAVLFGHRPDYVQSRVMRFSYGVKTNIPFHPRKHDRKYYVLMEGEEKCDNIFSQIAVKDETVEAGTKVRKSYFTPYKNQDVMDFMIYVSTDKHPSYVDEESCSPLCKQTITFPDICEEKRWVDVEYVFGNTEIGVKAVDRNSGKELSAKFNLI